MPSSPGSPRRRFAAWAAIVVAVLIGATAGTLVTLAVKGAFGGAPGTAERTPPASTASASATPSPPTASATVSATPTATSTPTAGSNAEAVATAKSLFPATGDHYGCGDASGHYASCAVSARLAARLSSLYGQAPYRPMCRCSRSWESVSFTPVGSNTVDVDFHFAPSGAAVTMVVSMIPDSSGTGLVADDTTCSGASIYSGAQPPACYMPG